MDIPPSCSSVQGRGGSSSVHSELGGVAGPDGIFLVDKLGPPRGEGECILLSVDGGGSIGMTIVAGASHFPQGKGMCVPDTSSIAWAG